MKSDILFMFRLIASAVYNGDIPKMPEGINWEKIYNISAYNSVANIVAYAIIKGKYDISAETKAKFTKKLYERIAVSENQSAEIKKLLKAFSDNEIHHMPMKGVILNELYPSSDMRFMADADILIKKEQYEKINEIMLELGYTQDEEGPIEYNYKKPPFVHIELHKYPVALSSEDLFDYYGDGWKFAKKSDAPYRYDFSVEDHFFYVFTHFVRHYRDAGAGLKFIIDIWLYIKKHPQMNWDYINNEAKSINMDVFLKNIIKLTRVWFEGESFDELISDMTLFILNSGTFGTTKNQMSASSIRDSKNVENAGKFKYLRFAFPPYRKMKGIFPILEKLPFLLPVFWIYRVIRFVLFRRSDFDKHKQLVENIDTESVNQYSIHMKAVGLDMYNGRRKK